MDERATWYRCDSCVASCAPLSAEPPVVCPCEICDFPLWKRLADGYEYTKEEQ